MFFTNEDRKKLERVVELQAVHTTELAVYNQSLKEHMRRSDLLEEGFRRIDVRVMPIERHVEFIQRSLKSAITVIAAAAGIATVIHYFFK